VKFKKNSFSGQILIKMSEKLIIFERYQISSAGDNKNGF
jgi:hypothetical protein